MTRSLYDSSVPFFVQGLNDVKAWFDKAQALGADEAALMAARLAPDMHPLPRQVQFASDSAKGAVARLTGATAPAMEDTESTFAELKTRCDRTLDFIAGVDRAAFEGAEDRPVELRFPSGHGFRFSGRDYLTGFALPNFFFHQSMTYALLRANGVALGKMDALQHLGAPLVLDAA